MDITCQCKHIDVCLQISLTTHSMVNKVEDLCIHSPPTLMSPEESLSITTGRCDLAVATHARKMQFFFQYDCQLEYFS
jgi:hypothetical protein